MIFFFFQAEDGIRDYKVTGVQTCALPICPTATRAFCRCMTRRATTSTSRASTPRTTTTARRSEEHTSELQSPCNLVCRLLLEKKNKKNRRTYSQLYNTYSLSTVIHYTLPL